MGCAVHPSRASFKFRSNSDERQTLVLRHCDWGRGHCN